MADYLIQDTTLDAIADAINAKTPAEMVTAIESISGGGGGSGYQLLASGSYTYTGDAVQALSIPVSFTGNVAFAYAVANEVIPDTNQSYCFLVIQGILPFLSFFSSQKIGVVSAINTSGVIYTNAINPSLNVEDGIFTLNRASNTYLIKPNTYNWYIYGEAAT